MAEQDPDKMTSEEIFFQYCQAKPKKAAEFMDDYILYLLKIENPFETEKYAKLVDFILDFMVGADSLLDILLKFYSYGKKSKYSKDEFITLFKDDLDSSLVDFTYNFFIANLNNLQFLTSKKNTRLGYKSDSDVKNHPWFNDTIFSEIENMTINSPFSFDKEDNFDDSYAKMEENDSIYEGNKELFILEVNDSMTFRDFYFNIEDLDINKENKEEAKDKNKTKTNFTSKTSNYKKSADDSSIVIHSIKNNNKGSKRKTAKFEGIQMNEDNKVVNVIRKGSRTGSMKLNLNKVE